VVLGCTYVYNKCVMNYDRVSYTRLVLNGSFGGSGQFYSSRQFQVWFGSFAWVRFSLVQFQLGSVGLVGSGSGSVSLLLAVPVH